MPIKKKKLVDATLEDLKESYSQGITSKIYQLSIYVPHGWIESPEENIVIASNFATNKQLQLLISYSSATSIERVNKTNILLKMDVVEPYITLFHGVCKRISGQAEIKIRAKGKEGNNE